MIKTRPVSDIMTRDVITVSRNDDLETAELMFKKKKIRHIPVVSGDIIVGMLSYTDLLRISFADAVDEDESTVDTIVYNMFTIEQVMAKNVMSVTPDTSIKEVAEILAAREFHAIPVVNDGHLLGIVTTTDLINYLLDQF
ncbi:MAG: CBS domain-containing protein [Bacteroidia bacterium]|nr:CBS domain-containing protein [Bacteroidia bacterium]MBT8268371.1 CBS domain-containing protein [Bacteroidia bacterium]NNK69895.1 CBS domain-containing protein [Flavobacteriaceae bacterium]NNL80286.1 CBS domain-containing protein [Flavobacteriaceae bacterium]